MRGAQVIYTENYSFYGEKYSGVNSWLASRYVYTGDKQDVAALYGLFICSGNVVEGNLGNSWKTDAVGTVSSGIRPVVTIPAEYINSSLSDKVELTIHPDSSSSLNVSAWNTTTNFNINE